mmetsp:Transcript_10180/g.22949  ORF Transcript_10180/g.22949 Transcript_10180/m.22949 type:complete len:363 (-) Transcript_10180:80-1168(-)|eukprot:CAMPEP_0197880024 /NCGR_PEP_ID=MMETSP1439-20131203/7954_1 /TAXON_ID=66791 /ORGANISM="Gonyaulax spinifera, Strain CCMP409" /LENGTH=362 /DNA_ID=CAMNT_0043499565 /DNA_START=89 /DNA_END=1177 /DNA_ORIENTATION=+
MAPALPLAAAAIATAVAASASGYDRPSVARCTEDGNGYGCDAVVGAAEDAGLGLLQRTSRHLSGAARRGGNASDFPSAPSGQIQPSLPIAWLHIPKCGSSFLNAIVRIPGACPTLPHDIVISDMTFGPQNLKTFFDQYPDDEYCPDALSTTGGHRGLGLEPTYERTWKGHAVTMLRQPEQRLLSAWSDGAHSWPATPERLPPSNIFEFAKVVQGCTVKMLTRAGNSHDITDVFPPNYGQLGPHWGGPCGSLPLPSPQEAKEAKLRLRDGFVFVGIQEEWEMSICLFHATFGGKCEHAEFEDNRKNRKPNHTHDASILQGFTDPYDGDIYEFGKKLLHDRLKSRNLSVEACQPCFKDAGIVYP